MHEKCRFIFHLPLNRERFTLWNFRRSYSTGLKKLTESYLVSNQKIKKAFGIENTSTSLSATQLNTTLLRSVQCNSVQALRPFDGFALITSDTDASAGSAHVGHPPASGSDEHR